MPYVAPERAEQLDAGAPPECAGDIQFLVARLVGEYILARPDGFRYQDLNDVLGALAGAQAEFYRRVVVPYEDRKIAENGDVYPEEILPNTDRPRVLRMSPSGPPLLMRDVESGVRLAWNGERYIEVEG